MDGETEGWMEEQMNKGTRVISQDAVPLTKNLMAKNLVLGPILALLTKIWALNKNVEVISLKFTENATPNITEKYIIITFFHSK